MKFRKSIFFMTLLAASSLSATQDTSKVATATTNSSSLNPSLYGQAVTFTAVVSPQPPNGEKVSFIQGSTTLGTATLSGGTATLTVSNLAEGTDNVYANYGGDSTLQSSSSTRVSQVVTAASTTTSLTPSQGPVNVGQAATFTATVTPQYSGTPAGNVAFYSGSTKLGKVKTSGGMASKRINRPLASSSAKIIPLAVGGGSS